MLTESMGHFVLVSCAALSERLTIVQFNRVFSVFISNDILLNTPKKILFTWRHQGLTCQSISLETFLTLRFIWKFTNTAFIHHVVTINVISIFFFFSKCRVLLHSICNCVIIGSSNHYSFFSFRFWHYLFQNLG